jgi:hypothetical protein
MSESYHHAEFEELCALAHAGVLSASERRRLDYHLAVCADCRQAYRHYRSLSATGIPLLASLYSHPSPVEGWDDRNARKALFARIRRLPAPSLPGAENQLPSRALVNICAWAASSTWVRGAVAACIIIAAVYGSYRAGTKRFAHSPVIAQSPTQARQAGRPDPLLESQRARIAALEEESSGRENEIGVLRAEQNALQSRSEELIRTSEKSQIELHSLLAERGALNAQLDEARDKYADTQKELANIQNERDKALLEVANLEANVSALQARAQEQERRLSDDEKYLAADRDIRELMGARKLYIADVFDVDSRSQTRKPFGRVFYTENKSLIFYAFDLDRQRNVTNATFQVWGEKDTAQGEKARPLNLGILYMDSESNRRWVLRCDDAKQLAEIDAVFVTVEPHGGSAKPTSKPFLYALLRKVANHP